ncbi:hypothetical protein [Mangrovimonas sp. YM274]|uniref:hypothetical protein n=1 Tax=Mangrovimonas sp. YM274 TaxID=3070660 RepID=UPI0027DE5739|nr:hypothetical protein [Mangrovimonas sp. YM274]WMI69859.1 hypothetical protein RBH95_05750 [Mangrovimonas sp. YM274]
MALLYAEAHMYRICIYPKDVSWLTGKGERSARELIRDIKLLHHKDKHQLVTIKEFCEYTGLPYDDVFNVINQKGSSRH